MDLAMALHTSGYCPAGIEIRGRAANGPAEEACEPAWHPGLSDYRNKNCTEDPEDTQHKRPGGNLRRSSGRRAI
jgi:hypothetical protein